MPIIYLRASQNSSDLIRQKNTILSYINEITTTEKISYISEITNEPIGRKFDELVLHGKFRNDILYVHSIDRISRDIKCIHKIFDILDNFNLKIFCVSCLKYFSINDIILREIFSDCSKLEREYFSLVTKKALSKLKDNGIRLGAKTKYDDEICKKIFELRNKGYTCQKIADNVGASKATVSRILNTYPLMKFDKRIELKENIKIDLENNLKHTDITKKYDISEQFLSKIIKEIKNDKLKIIADGLPLDLKQQINSEIQLCGKITEVAEKFNMDIDLIKLIYKSMKGGANW